MLLLRLRHPETHETLSIPVRSEVKHQQMGLLDYGAVMTWDSMESHGDTRTYVHWADPENKRTYCTAIGVPAAKNGQHEIRILTNWDVWLCNDQGRSIDRLHRFEEKA